MISIRSRFRRGACMGLTALAALAAANAQAHDTAASAPTSQAMAVGSHAGASKDLHSVMMNGMESMKNMPMSGDLDKDFAMMMKMHHEQAIAMAKIEAEHGKTAELKAMAQKTIKDQTKEIQQLDAWLKKHP